MHVPRNILKQGIGVVLATLVPVAVSVAGGIPAIDQALKASFADDDTSRYEYALADLNGDGVPEAVVLFTGPEWCGSGGCTMVILRGAKDAFSFVSSSTITRQPIRVLKEARAGWRTLCVSIEGGGVKPSDALMRFDGKRYPGNPTTQPRAQPDDLRDATTLEFKK